MENFLNRHLLVNFAFKKNTFQYIALVICTEYCNHMPFTKTTFTPTLPLPICLSQFSTPPNCYQKFYMDKARDLCIDRVLSVDVSTDRLPTFRRYFTDTWMVGGLQPKRLGSSVGIPVVTPASSMNYPKSVLNFLSSVDLVNDGA